jgi:hypothetical protein
MEYKEPREKGSTTIGTVQYNGTEIRKYECIVKHFSKLIKLFVF